MDSLSFSDTPPGMRPCDFTLPFLLSCAARSLATGSTKGPSHLAWRRRLHTVEGWHIHAGKSSAFLASTIAATLNVFVLFLR